MPSWIGCQIDQILGHGGFFKTPEVGQKIMAAAMNVPVSVMESAGEGGAWGIALLASYMLHKATDEPLEAYLSNKVFAGEYGMTIAPDQRDVEGQVEEHIRLREVGDPQRKRRLAHLIRRCSSSTVSTAMSVTISAT